MLDNYCYSLSLRLENMLILQDPIAETISVVSASIKIEAYDRHTIL